MKKIHKKALLFILIFSIIYFTRSLLYIKVKAENTSTKTIYLTFDDGPSQVTLEILKTLKKENVSATFFVIGENVKKHPEIFKQIIEGGHTIGIHSQSHKYKEIYKNELSLIKDINGCLSEIKAVYSNYTSHFYRFPGGSFGLSDNLKTVPKKLGLTYVDWNASCQDCEFTPRTYTELTERAVSTSIGKNTVIMLMHDAPNKQLTAKALPDIIKHFKEEGFSFLVLKSNEKQLIF